MVVYEVQVQVDAALAERFERYMRGKHIPEILATGCFAEVHFEQAGPDTFRTRYVAEAQADLDRYLRDHTARFREDFLAHFPEGARPAREVWRTLEAWRR